DERRGEPLSLSLGEKSLLVAPFGDFVRFDPFGELVMPHNPDAGELADIFEDAIELCRHQRAAAEMTVQRDVEIGGRLVGIETVEGVLVDVVPVARIAAQHAMIGEIRMRSEE